jgi:hypothetical protein
MWLTELAFGMDVPQLSTWAMSTVIRHPQTSPVCITQWSTYLEDLHARIAHRFFRPEVSQRAYRYLSGLLADEMSLEDECVEGAFSEIRNGWRA